MDNFIIRNKAELDTTEIDIFGDIGESFFDDSITFQNVKAQLQGINSSRIKMNVSSLGGDVNDALVIYNLLKTHPAKVEANIMGFTASSGTIIAMGADTITMDENAMFLVHNAWTGVVGNQHELRDVADNLEQIDNKLIQIYKDKTTKRKDSIANLMKEERWLDASEAKSFGFVDETYKPMKAAASYNKEIAKINGVKELPSIKVNNNNINNMNDQTLNVEELKTGIVTEVVNSVKEFFATKGKEVANEDLETSVKNEVEAKIEVIVNSHNEKVSALETEKQTFENTIKDLESKLAAYEVKPAASVANVEPTPTGDDKPVNAWDEKANEFKNLLKF